ncbi:hypothetical protein HYC85_000273 [Camellia sinensis]|uniref:Alkaline/neutral invertase n=1 Tax=Camellia sinensis TaxID=4442 RepID=A0A7J7I3T0_CAMSI|nr:hypothetical protein HYC85_000273 [Camellia sinensis]
MRSLSNGRENAFLNGVLLEEVYMQPPLGSTYPPLKVCKLQRALYSLKQAPRAWFAKFSSTIHDCGFTSSSYDTALFIRKTAQGTTLLLLYVDNMIITGDDIDGILRLKQFLSHHFEMKDLGPLSYFLGLEIFHDSMGSFLSQAKYTSDFLTCASLTDCKTASTPLESQSRLTPLDDTLLSDVTLYRKVPFGVTADNGNRTWYVDNAKKLSTIKDIVNGPDILDFKKVQESKQETEVFTSNGNAPAVKPVRDTLHKVCVDSIEDEAWELLQESMVYYCGSPIETIATKEQTSSNVLNYDQVFIRDFIPSGIAFLLKGEYDVVPNFILHTLQLQSWEKTMDCHSPGQGLTPASFKVRTVPLDAIACVATVDPGLWWIILLRGKCSGDLSVQERIDVQTGIKIILRLCLADGFDKFPTLLVTDGSCMIDRRMGIHGHPLEI